MAVEYRLKLVGAAGIRWATPVSWNGIKIVRQATEDFRNDYTYEIDGDFLFEKEDFEYFRRIERSPKRHDDIMCYLYEVQPDGSLKKKLTGYMNLRDADIDLDVSTILIDLVVDNPYQPLDDRGDEEINIFDLRPADYSRITHPRLGAEKYTGGRDLFWIMTLMLRRLYPGMTVKSDFFQWASNNPTYTIGHSAKLHRVGIFHRADIIRPSIGHTGGPYEQASILMMSVEDLINDLCKLFNLQYRIETGYTFRIEHVSYWDSLPATLDLTAGVHIDNTGAQQNYGYMKSEIVRFEKYSSELGVNPDFQPSTIEYDNSFLRDLKESAILPEQVRSRVLARQRYRGVTEPGTNRNMAEYSVKFQTDIETIAAIPENDTAALGANVPVLIAIGENSTIETAPAILDTVDKVNNVLSWALLLDSFHRHNRIFPTGKMNGAAVTFSSVKPMISQAEFWFDTAGADIDVYRKIKTKLGEGIVDTLEINLYTGRAYAEFVYRPVNTGLLPAPVCTNDIYSPRINEWFHSSIAGVPSLLANDVGATACIEESNITTAAGGSVSIVANGHFHYLPPVDFIGTDYFYYTAVNAHGAADTGTAFLAVRAVNIYVSVWIGYSTEDGVDFKDYFLRFFSDPAGTQPQILWGTGVDIKWRRVVGGVPGPVQTTPDLESWFLFLFYVDTANGNYTDYVAIEPDPDYIII